MTGLYSSGSAIHPCSVLKKKNEPVITVKLGMDLWYNRFAINASKKPMINMGTIRNNLFLTNVFLSLGFVSCEIPITMPERTKKIITASVPQFPRKINTIDF